MTEQTKPKQKKEKNSRTKKEQPRSVFCIRIEPKTHQGVMLQYLTRLEKERKSKGKKNGVHFDEQGYLQQRVEEILDDNVVRGLNSYFEFRKMKGARGEELARAPTVEEFDRFLKNDYLPFVMARAKSQAQQRQ